MLTVLLPECALGVQLPAPGYFANTHAAACCKSIFGSAGNAVAVVRQKALENSTESQCFGVL